MKPRSPIILAALLAVSLGGLPRAATTSLQEGSPPTTDGTDQQQEGSKPKKKSKARKQAIAELPEKYRTWLESVDILITKEERDAFLELEKDYQRDAFIENFWKVRDPYPQTPRNEFREQYEERAIEALERFGTLDEDRAIVLLTNDYPDVQIPINCTALWPAEVWYWRRNPKVGEFAVLFYQKGGGGRFRLWYPDEGLDALLKFPSGENAWSEIQGCRNDEVEALSAVFKMVMNLSTMGFAAVAGDLMELPERPTGEWMSTFHAYNTDLPDEAALIPVALDVDFPGRHQSRTVLQGIVKVSTAEAAISDLADYGTTYNLLITGEVLAGEKLFENFRYQFNLPSTQVTGDTIPLVFERYLRPGTYTLVLRIEDLNGQRMNRISQEVEVPLMERSRVAEPSDPETARLLAEANAAILTGDTTIKIVPPRGQYQTGMIRVDTLTTGEDIDQVIFDLDGRQTLIKREPPWSLELDLGNLPNMRTLTVIAQDAAGRELARDVMELNAGTHRFDVRLIEPRRNKRYERSLRAEAQVDVPEGGAVDRVEFYLNETLISTLFQPPWTQPILLNTAGELAYVRAVAYQPDDNFVEATVWINAPDYMENLEIQFVELFITVLDSENHPVQGLELQDFTVFEDNQQQEPRRFDRVTNLPIHAGILLDVSASMTDSLETAQRAALGFFEEAIKAKDRATLMTFNDHFNLAVKFTNDLPTLASGITGLKAERGTALYDSVIYALYYFNGIKGQRALILLSDGKDEHSRFTWENTLEYARRAGVSIYSIGLDLGRKNGDAKKKLVKLAEETGGRAFFIDSVDGLSTIYATIQEELRSRYYLAYQSTNTAEDTEFRFVAVEIGPPGLEAKTMRGYYP